MALWRWRVFCSISQICVDEPSGVVGDDVVCSLARDLVKEVSELSFTLGLDLFSGHVQLAVSF